MKVLINTTISSVLAFFILLSCNTPTKKDSSIEVISFAKEANMGQTDIVDSIKFISLETVDESLFMEVSQMITTDNEVFILDIRSNSIFIFDRSGTFKRKLSNIGQGPGEYSLVTSIALNNDRSKLYIADIDNKIISYDSKSLHFLNETKGSIGPSISILENGEFIGFNFLKLSTDSISYNNHILITDKNLSIKQTYLPIEFESGIIMSPTNRFYHYNNNTYVFPPFDNIIYKIENNLCLPYYQVEYGKSTLAPLSFLNKIALNENYIKELYKTNYIRHFQPFENQNSFLMTYYINSNKLFGIYDKKNKSSFYIKQKDNTSNFLFNTCGVWNDWFVSYSNIEDLKKQSLGKEQAAFLSLCKNTNISNESPILVLYKTK